MQGSIPGNSVEQSIGDYRTEIRHGSGLDTSARGIQMCGVRIASRLPQLAAQCNVRPEAL